jgi:hypothetical protein
MEAKMKLKHLSRVALITSVMALCAAPAVAQTTGSYTEQPPASPPPQAKAYGFYCQGESKKHVDGQKGTPFSQCVHAMRQLANGRADTPRQACRDLSKKHVKGQKRTPFAACVVGAAQLQKDLQGQSS